MWGGTLQEDDCTAHRLSWISDPPRQTFPLDLAKQSHGRTLDASPVHDASNPGNPIPVPMPLMELWASGFNAWGNLCFDDNTAKIWPDLHNFNPVLRDEKISPRALYRSATLGK